MIVVFPDHTYLLFCLHPNNLIEFSLYISVTKPLLIILADSQIPFQFHIESKKEGKDQESIHSSNTADPGYQWERDNVTIRYHKRESIGQPFPSR